MKLECIIMIMLEPKLKPIVTLFKIFKRGHLNQFFCNLLTVMFKTLIEGDEKCNTINCGATITSVHFCVFITSLILKSQVQSLNIIIYNLTHKVIVPWQPYFEWMLKFVVEVCLASYVALHAPTYTHVIIVLPLSWYILTLCMFC